VRRPRGRGGAWDYQLARRAAAISGLIGLLTLLVVATTDEGAPAARRLGMVAALLPIAGSVGAFSALRIAAGRGEIRALAAIGVDPLRAARGAILGGVAVALLGPMLASSAIADLSGLFPRPLAPRLWVADGPGMLELTLGLRLDPGGALSLVSPEPAAASPSEGAGAPLFFTVAALALAAIGGPTWIATSRSLLGRIGAGTLALLLAIGAFQGVAAGRLPPVALIGAPILLLIDAGRARYLARRR
jgi:hypothetical protein